MLYLIFLGAGIGFLYDLLRAIRKKTNNNVILCVVCDFIFWVLAISFSFWILFEKYSFDLRLYHFLLIGTGLSIYFTFLSVIFTFIILKIINVFEFFLKLVFTILSFCGKIIKNCFLFITFPIRWIFNKIKKLKIFKKAIMFFKFIKSKIIKQLHILKRL